MTALAPTTSDDTPARGRERVLLRGADGSAIGVELDWRDDVAGLARAVVGVPGPVILDGRVLAPDISLASVAVPRGARVTAVTRAHDDRDRAPDARPVPLEFPPTTTSASASASDLRCEVVAGPGAGRSFRLSPGTHTVGRHPDADLVLTGDAVSARHAEVTVHADGSVSIRDLGSRNGLQHDAPTTSTWTPGTCCRLGDTVLRLVDDVGAIADRRVGAGHSTVAVRRGVRRRRPAAGAEPGPRPTPPPAPARTPFRWTMIVLPLVMALGMAMLLDPRYALFALLSPVMMVGSWWEDRRGSRRRSRDDLAAHDLAVLAWSTARIVATRAEAAQRWFDHPGPAAARRRAAGGDGLWSARPGDHDASAVAVAVGGEGPDLQPLVVDLAPGRVLGIVGDDRATRRVLAAVVGHLVTAVGPDDLTLLPLDDPRWQWLPHVPDALLLGEDPLTLLDDLRTDRAVAVVTAVRAARTDVRAAVANGRLALIVVAPDVASLSDQTTATVVLDRGRAIVDTADGTAHGIPIELDDPSVARIVASLRACTVAADTSRGLPTVVSLTTLLSEAGLLDPAQQHPTLAPLAPRDPGRLVAVWGADADGPVPVDLVAEGPHLFLGGTTGAGKSELLRSLVLSLAVAHPPTAVQFVLVDFKGGATFDALAGLPHVLDLQTDLDGSGARRTLQLLEAELHVREQLLRDDGAEDLTDLTDGPARLVVVVDELAAFTASHDRAGAALADIAQRGRSLGVHLVLATQRPAGAVGADVRANTALRVALRTQDVTDARDVVDDPAPAHIDPRTPGRHHLRASGTLRQLQSAHSSAPADGGCRRLDAPTAPSTLREIDALVALVEARDTRGARRWPAPLPSPLPTSGLGDIPGVGFRGSSAPRTSPDRDRDGDAGSDIPGVGFRGSSAPRTSPDRDGDAGSDIPGVGFRGSSAPRTSPDRDGDAGSDIPGVGLRLVIGERDEPHRCRRSPVVWDPAEGPLLVHGLATAGAADALVTAAWAATRDRSPADLHVEGIDAGGGRLRDLRPWPHVVAVHDAADREALTRFVARLRQHVTQVRGGARRADVLVLVDSLGRLRARHDDLGGQRLVRELLDVALDGVGHGVWLAVSTARPLDAPPSLLGAATTRLVLTLAEPSDHAVLGMRTDDLPPSVAGRGYDAADGTHIQIAAVDTAAVATAWHQQWADVDPPAAPQRLPRTVHAASLPDPRRLAGGWSVPVGLDAATLRPTWLAVHPGEHVLVAGPARSGRTTLLRHVGVALTGRGLRVVVVTRRPDEWPDGIPTVTDVADLDDRSDDIDVLVVEDAARVPDHPVLLTLTGSDRATVVAAGRPGTLRLHHAAWLQRVRADRTGVLLRPTSDADGMLFDVVLRGPTAALPEGRGYAIAGGEPVPVQFAHDEPAGSS